MYNVNYETMSVPSFGAISFIPCGSITYAHDLLEVINNIFMVYNFNRIEWMCVQIILLLEVIVIYVNDLEVKKLDNYIKILN